MRVAPRRLKTTPHKGNGAKSAVLRAPGLGLAGKGLVWFLDDGERDGGGKRPFGVLHIFRTARKQRQGAARRLLTLAVCFP